MFTMFKRFMREEDGQDFAEYALILGAIGVVAIAVIARYRNLDTMDGEGHTRGYSFQGGALQSAWVRGKREAGIGAEYKQSLRGPGPWRVVLVAFADCGMDGSRRGRPRLVCIPTRSTWPSCPARGSVCSVPAWSRGR